MKKPDKAAALSRFFLKSKFAVEMIVDGEDTFEVRQPSVAKRNRIHKAAQRLVPIKKKGRGRKDEEDEVAVQVDTGELQLTAVLECVYLPGEAEPFFGSEHRELLAEMPVGGLYDKLAAAALRLMNIEPEEAAKNSEAT